MYSLQITVLSAVFMAMALSLSGIGPADAQIRYSCGTAPGPLRAISNDVVQECKIEDLTQRLIEYSEASRYYFCRSDLARRERDQNYDDTTYKLVNAQITSAEASINAAASLYMQKGGFGQRIKILNQLGEAVDNIKSASETASKGFSASEQADEFHRLGMNALHQANNAAKILEQWKTRRDAGEDCPPFEEEPFDPFDPENEISEEEALGGDEEESDPDDPFSPENEISREEAFGDDKPAGDEVIGTYSGFGITVEVLARGAMRVTSNCQEDDHRIQMQGIIDGQVKGTWQAIGVGVGQVTVSPPQTRDYQFRRRCDQDFSGAVIVPFKK